MPAAVREPCAESVAESTVSSWLAVSDISWQEVQSTAQEQNWEVVVDASRPAIEASLASLECLSKADITEVKSLAKPPHGVLLVMRAVCCLLGVPPTWKAAKSTLADHVTFLERMKSLAFFVPAVRLERAAPFVQCEDFDPEQVKKASVACSGLAMFIRNLYNYHALQTAAGEALELAERKGGEQEVGASLSSAACAMAGCDVALIMSMVSRSPAVRLVLSCAQHLVNPGGNTDAATLQTLVPQVCARVASWKQEVDEGSEARFSRRARDCVEMAKRLRRFKGLEFTAEKIAAICAPAGLLAAWVIWALAYFDLVLPRKLPALTVAEASEAAKQARAAQSPSAGTANLHKNDLVELKSLANPPKPVQTVCMCVCILRPLGKEDEEFGWASAKAMLSHSNFLQAMRDYSPCSATDEQIMKVRRLLSADEIFEVNNMRKISSAAAGLLQWLWAVVKEHDSA